MRLTGSMTSPPDGLAPPLPPDPGAGRGPDWLDAALHERLADVIELRRTLHAHPDLSRHEQPTTARVAAMLRATGIGMTELPGGTGLIAELGPTEAGRDGPLIGLRADLDALPLTEESGEPFASQTPGVMHACGHDVHTAVLVGAALALAQAPVRIGRVRLLFQPAEEVMDGCAQLIAAGALTGMDRAYALHCDPSVRAGQIALRTGAITSATDIVEIELSGPGGHTSRPHLTADLIGALGRLTIDLPPLLTRRLDPRAGVTLVWGEIRAGETFNVIPRTGVLRGTLRVLDRDAWQLAGPILAELVESIVAPTGARVELRHTRGIPPVINDPAAVGALRAGVSAALGPDAITVAEQSMGAEDFALLLDHVPGALARLGVWDGASPQVDLHSPAFHVDERAIAVGIRALVHTVLAAWGQH